MQQNTGIPLLNHYGLPLKRTRVELFFFDFARLLRLNRKTRHSLLRLKSRPESRAANHFKEEFFNLYKIFRYAHPSTRTSTPRVLPPWVGRTGVGCAEQDCCGSARKP